MKTFPLAIILVVAVLHSVVLPSTNGSVIISDGTFNQTDWQSFGGFQQIGHHFPSFSQKLTGGNPGAYLDDRVVPNFINTADFFHIFTAATYDPATQGAITSLLLSMDVRDFVLNPNNFTLWSFVVKQNNFYYSFLSIPASGAGWNPGTPTLLTETDLLSFTKFSQVGERGPVFHPPSQDPLDPDFSATGAPIQFGYLARTRFSDGLSITETGVDNWSVQVNPVPEPGVLGFLIFGLTTLALSRRPRV